MIDSSELVQIVNDPRLSADAVRLILHVASRGDGPQEVDADELRLLLGCKSDRPVYHARERAERYGYLRWQQGGRAHANVYEYLGLGAEVKADTSATGPEYVAPVVVVEEGDDIPPVIPLPVLHRDAERVIAQHGDKLAGCRGALRDYLLLRVAPPRQASWVQMLASILDGLGFNWHGRPRAEWAGLVAAALNDLAATDEAAMKSPPGDPRNFRTKLGIFAQAAASPQKQQATGTDGGRRWEGKREKQPLDAQEYTPTNEKPGWRR